MEVILTGHILIISNENSKPYGCLECTSLLGSDLSVEKYFISHFQLELTKTQVMKLTNEDGFVEKADFIKCCQVINKRKCSLDTSCYLFTRI